MLSSANRAYEGVKFRTIFRNPWLSREVICGEMVSHFRRLGGDGHPMKDIAEPRVRLHQ